MHLKFGTLMNFLELITYYSWESFDFRNNKRDNERKRRFAEALSNLYLFFSIQRRRMRVSL